MSFGVRLVAGVWVILSGAMVWVMAPHGLGFVGLPLLFVALGGAGLGLRYSVTIDGVSRQLQHSLGWIVPIVTIFRQDAASFGWVALGPKRHVFNRKANPYQVLLVGPNLVRSVVHESNVRRARATAETVAKLLGLGVADELTQSGFREAGSLDEPLRARLRRCPPLPALDTPPPRLVAERADDELRVRLPRANALPQLRNFSVAWLLASMFWILPLIYLSGLKHPAVDPDGTGLPFFAALALLASTGAAVVSYRELAALERDVTLFVSPRALGATIEGPLGRRVVMLPTERLESVGVGHHGSRGWLFTPQGIVACADDQVIQFGWSCDPQELAWLIRAIHSYVRGA